MSAPLVPSPLDCIGRRRFAFYPAIARAQPNEWILGVGTRSEIQVLNAETGREIWMSREYIGAVSESGASPVLVVGLTKALEFREGLIEPKIKRVIEMPSADHRHTGLPRPPLPPHARPAAVVGIRLEPRSSSAFNKTLLLACTAAVVIALLCGLTASTLRF